MHKKETHSSNSGKLSIATTVGLVLLVLLLLGSLGYAAFILKQKNDLQATLTSEQTKNQTLMAENTSLKTTVSATPTTPTITDTLPNGKTITYPDTPGNRNILWWSAGPTLVNESYVYLSHKAYQQYMTTVASNTLVAMCGTYNNLKALQTNIIYGVLNTTTKQITPPQNQDCVEAIAAADNPDAVSRAAAQKVLDQVNADVTAFLKSATIK